MSATEREQARALLATYLQEAEEAQIIWQQLKSLIEPILRKKNERQKAQLLRAAFQEVSTLYRETMDWENIPLQRVIMLVVALKEEAISYTIEDIQDILQSISHLFTSEVLKTFTR